MPNGRSAEDWRREERIRRREYNFKQVIKDEPQRPKVLAEGDSWFVYKNGGVIGKLYGKRRYAILRIAANGDTVSNILAEGQYLGALREYDFVAFLFSGGGNDVLGEGLPALLNDREQVAGLDDVVNRVAFDRTLATLRGQYRELIRKTLELRPACKIVLHGYDYAEPSGTPTSQVFIKIAGPWLKPRLNAVHVRDKREQRYVVRVLVDGFNEMLSALQREDLLAAAEEGRPQSVYYVNLRDTVGGDWEDEIHPDTDGFGRIADQFDAKLREMLA